MLVDGQPCPQELLRVYEDALSGKTNEVERPCAGSAVFLEALLRLHPAPAQRSFRSV